MINPLLWLKAKVAGGEIVEFIPNNMLSKSNRPPRYSYSLPIKGSKKRLSWKYWNSNSVELILYPNGEVGLGYNGHLYGPIKMWLPLDKEKRTLMVLSND